MPEVTREGGPSAPALGAGANGQEGTDGRAWAGAGPDLSAASRTKGCRMSGCGSAVLGPGGPTPRSPAWTAPTAALPRATPAPRPPALCPHIQEHLPPGRPIEETVAGDEPRRARVRRGGSLFSTLLWILARAGRPLRRGPGPSLRSGFGPFGEIRLTRDHQSTAAARSRAGCPEREVGVRGGQRRCPGGAGPVGTVPGVCEPGRGAAAVKEGRKEGEQWPWCGRRPAG